MEPGESDLDIYRKRFIDRMLRKGAVKDFLDQKQYLVKEKSGQIKMKLPGVEITDEVFIGIQDYITALENPLPPEPKKGKKSYSFGSEIEPGFMDAERIATS